MAWRGWAGGPAPSPRALLDTNTKICSAFWPLDLRMLQVPVVPGICFCPSAQLVPYQSSHHHHHHHHCSRCLFPNPSGALQLGRNFSPWTEPAEGNVLNTTGVYSLCRHPLYAGLVAFSLGLGFSTDSFTRIALACLLGYVLVSVFRCRGERKRTRKEGLLLRKHVCRSRTRAFPAIGAHLLRGSRRVVHPHPCPCRGR